MASQPMSATIDLLPLAGRLFINGLRCRLLKRLRRPGPIQALSLEITHRCICRCVMCNIWQIPHGTRELPLSAWADLLAEDVFANLAELDITGGEPFLKSGLPAFFNRLKTLKRTHLRDLRSVAITTNAILTRRVLDTTRDILEIMNGTGVQLVLAIAMDALDDRHDRIRGHAGAFQKMRTTLDGLMALRARYPALVLGIKTTILPLNVDQLVPIDAFARRHGLFSIISPCIITGGRYLNQDRRRALSFNPQEIDQMVDFFSRADLDGRVHARSLTAYLRSGTINKTCSCGFNYAFVRSTGHIHLCPLLSSSVGNVEDSNFTRVWHSPAARALRGRIGKSDACRHCTEPGLERYALLFEGWAYLGFLFALGPMRFKRLHAHLGLDCQKR